MPPTSGIALFLGLNRATRSHGQMVGKESHVSSNSFDFTGVQKNHPIHCGLVIFFLANFRIISP
jgi:hypothetical protein